jgi:predicted lipid-binding transport protein (Tim44 family)
MKSALRFALLLVLCLGLAGVDAEAKRLAGGRNVGAQRAAPAQAQKQAAPATAANPAPAASPSLASRWLGPAAGVLAGLGLGALLAHTGLGGTLGLMLVAMLAVVVATLLLRRWMRPAPGPVHGPLRYAGPTPGLHLPAGYETQPPPAARLPATEYQAQEISPASGASPRLPAGFEPEPFLKHARLAFARIQAAFDQADYGVLGDLLTPEMLSEARAEIVELGSPRLPSEIVTLNAELIEVVAEGLLAWSSVRFFGLIREGSGGTATAFDEIWNLQKPLAGPDGWRLAGIQQLRTL